MILHAESVSKEYKKRRKNQKPDAALKQTDFVLEEGALTILRGASGSGKTTLLNILAGLLNPSEGHVFLDDTDIYALSDEDRSRFRNQYFGIIPQGQTLLSCLTVFENVLLPYTLYGEKVTAEIKENALSLLKRLGIDDLKDNLPSELSGGERRRVAVARALVKNPKIVLADEPTGDLDEKNTEIILNLFEEYKKNGSAVLMVTHEKDIDHYADNLYRMDTGEIFRSVSLRKRA